MTNEPTPPNNPHEGARPGDVPGYTLDHVSETPAEGVADAEVHARVPSGCCVACGCNLQGMLSKAVCPACGMSIKDALHSPLTASSALGKGPRLVTWEATCIACAYPLRGLMTDADCPECGVPVADSVAKPLIQPDDLKLIRKIRRGVLALMWWMAFVVLLPGAAWWPFAVLLGCAAPVLFASMCRDLTAVSLPNRGRWAHRSRRLARALGVWQWTLVVAVAVCTGLHTQWHLPVLVGSVFSGLLVLVWVVGLWCVANWLPALQGELLNGRQPEHHQDASGQLEVVIKKTLCLAGIWLLLVGVGAMLLAWLEGRDLGLIAYLLGVLAWGPMLIGVVWLWFLCWFGCVHAFRLQQTLKPLAMGLHLAGDLNESAGPGMASQGRTAQHVAKGKDD